MNFMIIIEGIRQKAAIMNSLKYTEDEQLQVTTLSLRSKSNIELTKVPASMMNSFNNTSDKDLRANARSLRAKSNIELTMVPASAMHFSYTSDQDLVAANPSHRFKFNIDLTKLSSTEIVPNDDAVCDENNEAAALVQKTDGTKSNEEESDGMIMYYVVEGERLLWQSMMPIHLLPRLIQRVVAKKSASGKRLVVVNVDEMDAGLMDSNREELPSRFITSWLRISETENSIYLIDASPPVLLNEKFHREVKLSDVNEESLLMDQEEFFSFISSSEESMDDHILDTHDATGEIQNSSEAPDNTNAGSSSCGLLQLARSVFKPTSGDAPTDDHQLEMVDFNTGFQNIPEAFNDNNVRGCSCGLWQLARSCFKK
ncbi:hypothetical protein GE061_000684 [Apolygus lucorum]|uniref:Uncharacterized protein n=1 Tax=Apolygus lucorum TaxID=248454 RepID=A0A8S9Y596_APOLU|nr:hypothetical protein GE061_000684 [Apolygus lucorum]